MFEKIKELIKKYRELILYVIFGALTTAVNYAVYFPIMFFTGKTPLSESTRILIAQVASWIVAVAFAFVTNKLIVFGDKDKSKAGLFRQITEFAGARLATLGSETVLLLLFVNVLHMNEYLAKIIVSVITVILNYFASKLVIFRKKKEK